MESVLNKFEAFLLTERRCALNTFHAYMQDLRQFIAFLTTQNKKLSETEVVLLKGYLSALKKTEHSARSVARKISSLKVFFKWAHAALEWPDYTHNLVFPKIEKKLPNYLTQEEIQELLKVAYEDVSDFGKRNLVMLYLLYTAGLRITELTTLQISSIDFDTGCLTVQGKGGKGRIVPLPQIMVALLKDYLSTFHKKFIETHGKADFLFPIIYAGKIRPISRQAFWGILKELCKKTTIQRPVSPHVLRHSLATHLLKNGAHLRSLQLLLGHENLSTVQIYTHVELSYLRSIYDKKHPRS
jgi:integrase/recombinase XerD